MTSEIGTDLPSSPALLTFRSGSEVGTDLRVVWLCLSFVR